MKPRSTGRSTAVYDFDEGDAEPYITKLAKRKKFLKAFSKGRRLSNNGCKDEMDNCEDVTERLTQTLCCESSHATEGNGNHSSSVSDAIESDNSDCESRRRRRVLDMRFGGVLVASYGALKEEDLELGEGRKVVLHGEELCFSHGRYALPELIFTTDAIELKSEDFGAVKLPLCVITDFRFGSNEKDVAFVELHLTRHGSELLQQHLGHVNKCSLSDTIISTFSDSVSLVKKIRQITSLSDDYKLIWRSDKEHFREEVVRSALQGREGFDVTENEHLLGDCSLNRRSSLSDWHDLIYPTQNDRDAVTVTKYDYALLDPDQFLSDTVVDFYIKYLQTYIPEVEKDRFYFYNSFFFRKLTEANNNFQSERSKSAFERVKRWTAGTNILDKDYLFVPIMQNAHWSLVIICHPRYLSTGCSDANKLKVPLILHFDSLEGCHTYIEGPIKSYVLDAWKEKALRKEDSESPVTLKFLTLKVPQQTNYSDCGLFLLHYVELFIKEALDNDFSEPVLEEFPFHGWFNPKDASRKRVEIQDLIDVLRPKKSSEEHPERDFRAVTDQLGSLQQVQRSNSCGPSVCDVHKAAYNLDDNLSEHMYSANCSHQCHHGNDIQSRMCTRLGHEHVELEYLDVIGEYHHACHCSQHCTLDELGGFPLLQHRAAANPMTALLMPPCTHVDCNHLVQNNDNLSFPDCWECGTFDIKTKEFGTSLKEGNGRFDQSAAKVEDAPTNVNVVEARSSNALVHTETEDQVEVAFCCHFDDIRTIDDPFSSSSKFPNEGTFSEGVLHACSSTDGSSVKRVKSPSMVNNIAIDGSIVAAQDSKDNSLGDPVVLLEGLETVTIIDATSAQRSDADENVLTQQDCPEICTDKSCVEGAKLRPVSEVTASDRHADNRVALKEDCTSTPSSKEDCHPVAKLQLTEECSVVREVGSEGLQIISTNLEPHSSVANNPGGSKSPRTTNRNKRCKVGSTARRITRSLAKDKDQGKGTHAK